MIGDRLGPYRIDRELGSGGMGVVYAAVVVDRVPGLAEGTRVALKVVHPHLLETPGFFKRFLREAEIGRSVVHENVVRTLDCDAALAHGVQQNFLVMEYVEGQTLRDLLRELDRVPEELCRHIGCEVAKGLAAIHAAGVVHRDMKPENVLITKDHVVKVMDLGLARLSDEALRLSLTGVFVGSIQYAAPECFTEEGTGVDGRADLHALGLVLYELSCGVNPYLADAIPQILNRILREEPRRLGEVNPQLSPFFEEVVHCLLAKRPENRFADASALRDVLEEGESSAWWRTRAKAIGAQTHRPMRRIRIPRETAVYGRETELAKLRQLFEKAASGDGQVVLIEGEAGVGKSRLVDELVGHLQRDGHELNFLFGSYPPGGAATAAGAFSTAFREHFGEEGAAAWLAQTPALVPAFDALLRGETTPPRVEPLTKDSLQTCFVHVTRNLAAQRTTVLLIDDLHFATEDARALFTSLAMGVPGHRILLVGTSRPGLDERWLAGLTRLPQASQMSLGRLGPKDLACLLRDSFRSEQLTQRLAMQIGLKSDGNPFFAFEIIRGLREGQYIAQRDDGTWASTREIDDIQIPSSVLDLVNARVADLSEDERNLLDVAACWGFEFDPLLVGEVLGIPRIPLLRALGQIERRHRLVRSSGIRFVFDHHQVQEALYGALSELLRREYHAALACALEARTGAAEKAPSALDGALCVDLCEQFLKGAQGERALRYLEASLAHLEKGHQSDAAIRVAERALAVPGLLVGLGRAKTLLRLCAEGAPLDRLGRRGRQEAAAREAESLAAEAADDEVRGMAAQALGNLFWETSRYADAEGAFRRSQEVAQSRGDRKTEAAATNGLGVVCWSQGRFAEAREHFERDLEILRETRDRVAEARATGNLGLVLSSQGRYEESRAHIERDLAISRELGYRQGEAVATGNLGINLLLQGRFSAAREHCERAIEIHREVGDRAGEARTLGSLAGVLLAQGHVAQAGEHYERALAIVREIGFHRSEGFALLGLGCQADEAGAGEAALRFVEESLALRRRIGHGDGVADSLLEVADLRRRAGDAEGARAALDEALPLARERKRAPQVALALAMLACLPGGGAAAAVTAFAEAGDTARSRRTCWLLWKATGDRTYLSEAKRLLDELLAKNPDHRESMLANIRLNREIAAAGREAGL